MVGRVMQINSNTAVQEGRHEGMLKLSDNGTDSPCLQDDVEYSARKIERGSRRASE